MKRLLLALVSLALVASAAAAASTPASDGKTLDLTGTVTAFHVALDAKPTGQSAGDIGYETGNLFMHGKRIGRFQGICAQLPHASSQCSFTLGLPDGQILIQAAYGPGFNTGAVAREAIVGGTGAYAGARGQGRDRELSNSKLAFHLELIQ
jgi:opacity protein-like surface antigen